MFISRGIDRARRAALAASSAARGQRQQPEAVPGVEMQDQAARQPQPPQEQEPPGERRPRRQRRQRRRRQQQQDGEYNYEEEQQQREREQATAAQQENAMVLEKIKEVLDVLALVWFTLGNAWVFGSRSCSKTSPGIFYLSLAIIITTCTSVCPPRPTNPHPNLTHTRKRNQCMLTNSRLPNPQPNATRRRGDALPHPPGRPRRAIRLPLPPLLPPPRRPLPHRRDGEPRGLPRGHQCPPLGQIQVRVPCLCEWDCGGVLFAGEMASCDLTLSRIDHTHITPPNRDGMFGTEEGTAVCPICLGEYIENETLRVLQCSGAHHFHIAYVRPHTRYWPLS
jgi:hypothetical protein